MYDLIVNPSYLKIIFMLSWKYKFSIWDVVQCTLIENKKCLNRHFRTFYFTLKMEATLSSWTSVNMVSHLTQRYCLMDTASNNATLKLWEICLFLLKFFVKIMFSKFLKNGFCSNNFAPLPYMCVRAGLDRTSNVITEVLFCAVVYSSSRKVPGEYLV
jgi:hypothetical protein